MLAIGATLELSKQPLAPQVGKAVTVVVVALYVTLIVWFAITLVVVVTEDVKV